LVALTVQINVVPAGSPKMVPVVAGGIPVTVTDPDGEQVT
jgi:hypothetical protein